MVGKGVQQRRGDVQFQLFGMIVLLPSFISHKAKYIYKIRTFLLTFSVQSVIIIKLIRDSPVDRV